MQTVDFENHGIHVQIVDTQKQPVPLATVHLDGPAPQDTTTDEHGFVTFWGLVAGDYTVERDVADGHPDSGRRRSRIRPRRRSWGRGW